ncbi:hypothetical protein GUJ93_ZPchr0010g8344 [Zizania palustris]|uniref:Uncharacterized protein n=1 Tax=Zizania palustris TaxID=103762 RepID=A0A8J5W7L0_ZIZPA|nr:hypothetical protein GUJ93_ZPchr0010g8344 [Zizania palustris]
MDGPRHRDAIPSCRWDEGILFMYGFDADVISWVNGAPSCLSDSSGGGHGSRTTDSACGAPTTSGEGRGAPNCLSDSSVEGRGARATGSGCGAPATSGDRGAPSCLRHRPFPNDRCACLASKCS